MTSADDLALVARVVASLVVVMVVLALAARLARRSGVRGPGAGLRVLDRTGLSREASIAVVEVGGRALVLGVTPHQVSVLAEVAPDELPVPEQRRAGRARPAPDDARPAVPAGGSVLSPATWRQGIEAVRDLTARRG